VGLLAVPLGKSQLHEIALYHEPFWVLVRNDSPVARKKQISHKDLDPQSIWLLTEGHCLREQVLDICAFKKTKNTKSFTFESGSLETLKNIIESYGGYTLVPQLATSNYGKNCRLLPFERPIPARMVGLVHRRKEHKAPLIEKLSEAILDSIPGDIRNLRQKHLDVIPVE
ncbi:MAG: LysR substrate-binding domain-containing protein, partial [Bdellovibrionaceae bacterium]|nr:LysR substrate-binding domain-containing protein [Pseudobdellovibrionaceae bacterium]